MFPPLLSSTKKRLVRAISGIALLVLGTATLVGINRTVRAQAPPAPQSPLTVRSDIQEANSETGVVTARGNVQFFYPARQMQGTAAQAQYYSRERRLVLTGNVYVLQEGNSMRSEIMTYLIDEGRFIATPQSNQQVESIYLVTEESEEESPAPAPLVPTPPLLGPAPPLSAPSNP